MVEGFRRSNELVDGGAGGVGEPRGRNRIALV